MGQHKHKIPKVERDGAWKRGQRPKDFVRLREAVSTFGRNAPTQKRATTLEPLPEVEAL